MRVRAVQRPTPGPATTPPGTAAPHPPAVRLRHAPHATREAVDRLPTSLQEAP
ncbi:hypothetical protein [Streptomyces sp. enrichment culture]|uniref:hypothetical protein n=1 Tax=Streptomyces sp. enrichment culture TaxID=1795815 RepID=UPI003F57E69E